MSFMPFLIFCSERAGCGDGDGVGAYGREEGAVDSAGDAAGDAALVGSVDALLRRSRCGCFAADALLRRSRCKCFLYFVVVTGWISW